MHIPYHQKLHTLEAKSTLFSIYKRVTLLDQLIELAVDCVVVLDYLRKFHVINVVD